MGVVRENDVPPASEPDKSLDSVQNPDEPVTVIPNPIVAAGAALQHPGVRAARGTTAYMSQ